MILLSDRSFVAACRPENTSITIACRPGVPARQHACLSGVNARGQTQNAERGARTHLLDPRHQRPGRLDQVHVRRHPPVTHDPAPQAPHPLAQQLVHRVGGPRALPQGPRAPAGRSAAATSSPGPCPCPTPPASRKTGQLVLNATASVAAKAVVSQVIDAKDV